MDTLGSNNYVCIESNCEQNWLQFFKSCWHIMNPFCKLTIMHATNSLNDFILWLFKLFKKSD